MQILDEGIADVASTVELAVLEGVCSPRSSAGDGDGVERRKGSNRHVAHRFSEEEC